MPATIDLLDRYDIPYDWDAPRRRLLIGATDVAPSHQADQVSPRSGDAAGHPAPKPALMQGARIGRGIRDQLQL